MASTDKDALLALYDATSGPNWSIDWDKGAELKAWHGVDVNDQGRVVQLDLSANNLQGVLSTNLSYDVLDLPQEFVGRQWAFQKIASFMIGHNVVFVVRPRVLHTVYA